MGQRETLKDSLRRDLYFERAGLSVETSGSAATKQVVNESVKNTTKKMQRQEARKRRRQRKKLEKQLKMEEKRKQENAEKLDVEISSSDESVEDYDFTERVIDSKKSYMHSVPIKLCYQIRSTAKCFATKRQQCLPKPKKKKEKFKMPKQTAFFVTVKRDPKIQKRENAASGLRNGARNC